MPRHQRRQRIAYLPYAELLQVLNGQCICLMDKVPSDTRIVNVGPAPERASLGVMLESSSFDVVPEGTLTPTHEDIKWSCVEPMKGEFFYAKRF